jgi:hypothetical protein
MFSKSNLTSTILTALWGFFGGYLLWGYLTVDFFNDHLGSATGVMKENPDMLYLALGCLINAFAFSTIYGKWANGKFSVGSGVSLGVWIAIILGLVSGLIDYSTRNIVDLVGMFGNFGGYLIFMIVLGALAGFSYNKMS